MARPKEAIVAQPAAEWRIEPIAERELATQRRAMKIRRRLVWASALSLCGVCPLTCLGSYDPTIGPWPFWLTELTTLGLVIAALRRIVKTNALELASWNATRWEHAAVDGWPTTVDVLQGAAITGRDRGTVWFEDGRLFFVGERTSFGLAPSQVAQHGRKEERADGSNRAFVLPLAARTEAGSVSVRFQLVFHVPFGAVGYRDYDDFSREVRRWIAVETLSEGQLPPLSLGPDAPRPNLLLARALGTTMLWTVYLASSAYAMSLSPVSLCGVLVAPVLLLFWPTLWEPRVKWRAFLDRRRLDRGRSS